MGGLDFQLSNIVLIVTLVLVVVGLVLAVLWFFKRAENITDEDRVNIERVKVAWIGATALGVLILVAAKKEGKWTDAINGKRDHKHSSRPSALL